MNRSMRRGHSPPPNQQGPPVPYDFAMESGGAKDCPPQRLYPSTHQEYDDIYHTQGNLYDFHQTHHPRHPNQPPPPPPPHPLQIPNEYTEPNELMHPHQYPIQPHNQNHHHRLPPPPLAPPQSQAYNHPHHQQSYPSSRDQLYPEQANISLDAGPSAIPTATYKILCITNINPKVSDHPVKEALTNDFSRFGDISVTICHDSGERLAYIYFRSYESAREARHAKTRTILFDRPLEIEPIYESRASPPVEPITPNQYSMQHQQYTIRGRRSMTPSDYYDATILPHSRRPYPSPTPPIQPQMQPTPYPYHRDLPSPSYGPARSSYAPPPGHGSGPGFERHYNRRPTHSTPPLPQEMAYEQYRPLPPEMGPFPYESDSSYRHSYGGPPQPPPIPHHMHPREREHMVADSQLPRSFRHEQYNRIESRSSEYSANQSHPAFIKDSRGHPQDISSNRYSSGGSSRRSPPYPDHSSSSRFMSRDFRREKYGPDGYNNNNLEPEEGRPSRILFVTNIDQSKTEEEIIEIFTPFGSIEELELRKILQTDISSCLIKFSSMDCAYRAKTAINGKILAGSKKPSRVAYGKVSTSRRLWIGGLGAATTIPILRDKFKKFGEIINLDYVSGRPYAYVEYETPNQAQFATHHLKGTMVAESEKKLRIEYVDSTVDRTNDNSKISKNETTNCSLQQQQKDITSRSQPTNQDKGESDQIESGATQNPQISSNSLKRSISPSSNEANSKRPPERKYSTEYASTKSPDINRSRSSASNQQNKEELNNNFKVTPDASGVNGENRKSENNADNIKITRELIESGSNFLNKCNNIAKIIDSCSVSWHSQMVLRNFNFMCNMSLCSGDKSVIEKYITKLNGSNVSFNHSYCPTLKITQRWRLNPQPKLEEVRRKMQTANLGIIIITAAQLNQSSPLSSSSPASCMKTPQTPNITNTQGKHNGEDKELDMDQSNNGNNTDSPTSSQSRPLKNLISYLEQKDAAGVVSLRALDQSDCDGTKLLYAFPPGDFALNLLKLKAENLSSDTIKEEFLLGVIV